MSPIMLKNIFITSIIFLSLVVTSCAGTTGFMSNSSYSPDDITTTRAALTEDAFWQGNTNTIWDRLQHIPTHELASASTPSNPERAAWIKLAIISKKYNSNSHDLVQQLAAWRSENPNHPANNLFSSNGTLTAIADDHTPRHIALLLPLQGPMGANGHAVRNGFLSAYYQTLAKTHVQQTISFFDTSGNQNIAALYQQAVSEGADVIVGPLTKEDVQNLVNSGSIRVPTLALNYTEGSLPTNFYEFGLSPVDEIQQVADKAWSRGRSHAIIIAPDNAWGHRMGGNLTSRWQSLGGGVTDTLFFNQNTDYNQAIASLLHVNPVEDNRKKSEKETNKTLLEKQRRQDFDVIFLLAEPNSARQIVPLLRYYYASDIPVYSTSVIYSGSPNPQKDSDLNGVIFADIPWLLKSSHNNGRLYAVGRDAYAISRELPRLTTLPYFPLYGATGALTLSSSHQIYRRLPMAEIHNGHP